MAQYLGELSFPKICQPKAGAAIQSDGIYAIICTVEQSLYSEPDQTLAACKGHLNYLAHQVYWSELVHNHYVPLGRTELIKEPSLYLVNVEDTFVSPVIAVPYDLSDPDQIGWLFVEPVGQIPRNFAECQERDDPQALGWRVSLLSLCFDACTLKTKY